MASGADDDATAPAKAGADAAAPSAARRDDAPVPSPWRDMPPAADACIPVLGVAELWPELSCSAAAAKGKKAPAASSSTAAPAPKPIAALRDREQGATNKQICDPPTRHHGDRTVAATVEPSPTNAPNSRERHAAAPEKPPMHASSYRSSNAGVRGGHHHQSGRFVPHTPGRGGEGFNGGGKRRPAGGANGGRGNANTNGSTTYRNRGGGRHGQEHRGGFNGQPRGRGLEDRHTPLGSPAGYIEAPHHMHPQPLPPAFMPIVIPPYPYYYGPPVGYGPYGYGYPEHLPFVPEIIPSFIQYAAPINHMEAGPSQMERPQQKHAPQQQPIQAQQAPNQIQQPNPEQMRQDIRQQVEYYFSAENLKTDTFLRERMDEQGWVSLTLIAGFKKIFTKTTDMDFILDSILPSTEVEVLDGKIRKRIGWEIYSLP